MRKAILLFFALVCAASAYSQNVGIGTTSPAAKLDISATDNGILIPRVALTATNSASPLTSPTPSTLVYNTANASSGATAVIPGFYYWNGSAWVLLIDYSSLSGATTVSNTSTTNTLHTTVNGVTGTGVPMINSNTLGLSGTSITSTINGIGSASLDLSSLDNNIYNTDGTLTGNRTVTMGADNLTFSATTGDVVINGNNFLATGTYGTGSIPATGAGTRMMWYPAKAAFRVGSVTGSASTYWDDANIGTYSIALGHQTQAYGNNGTAMGYATTAYGDYSTAMGFNSSALGDVSTVMGNTTYASGLNSIAMGNYTQATGNTSIAIGDHSVAGATLSIAMGYNTFAYSFGEMAVGAYNTYYIPSSAYIWVPTDRLFSIGNGTGTSARSDAMVVLKNGNIGIATATPVNKLDVQGGNIDASGYIQSGGSGGGAVLFGGTTAANGGALPGGASFEGRPRIGDWGQWLTLGEPNGTNGGMVLQIQGTKIYTGTSTGITAAPTLRNVLDDGSGNVGIGTTTPGSKLEVSGNTKTTNFQMTAGAAAATLMTGDGSGNGSWTSVASILAGLGTGTQNYVVKFNNASGTTIGNSQIFDNGTNVGIGQTFPQSTLDVNGNIQISNATIPMGLMTEVQGTTPLLDMDVNFRESNKTNTYMGAAFRIDTRGGANPLFQWITRPAGSGAESIPMVLTSSGSLGIGTTTPQSTLDVNGGVSIGTYAGTTAAPSNGIITSGKVGIGTTTPQSKLDVNGGVTIGSYAGTTAAPSNGMIVSGNVGIGTSSLTNFTNEALVVVGGLIQNEVNSQSYPYYDGNGGWAAGWNFTGANGEVDFWNPASAGSPRGFVFRQQTGASAQTAVMTVDGSGNFSVPGTGTIGGNLTASSNLTVSGTASLASWASQSIPANSGLIGTVPISGYAKVGSILIQWGAAPYSSNNAYTVTFPTGFSHIFSVTATVDAGANGGSGTNIPCKILTTGTSSFQFGGTQAFSSDAQSMVRWIAIGN